MLICSALKGANGLCEECWVVEVCGLALGWFRGEQEWDSGGQSVRNQSQNYMVQPGTRRLEVSLPTERNRRGENLKYNQG